MNLFSQRWGYIEAHYFIPRLLVVPVVWGSVFQYGISVVSESYTGLAKAHQDSESWTLATDATVGAPAVVDKP